MSKYPFVYILRDTQYNDIDDFFLENKDKLQCTVEIISLDEIKKLNNMFDSNHHILITYGDDEGIYISLVMGQIVNRMRNRWIHKTSITDINEFNHNVNYCYINNVIEKRELTRPKFSVFTTCYKSYEKINRAYGGLKSQRLRDWEWILLDDSPEDEHFDFLRKFAKEDKRIRLYKRDCNSGNIGNVKNEAVGLCRGKYVLELDHDDIILPNILQEAYDVFESDDEIGFVFSDFANLYENGGNFSYGDHICKGYGCYYMQKIDGHWYKVYSCPGINNITTSHLVCLPNHPRMWRRKVLMELENYSEFLPICDDFEILMRTMCNTKVAKIHKIGYIQFMNKNNNNFSLIRNGEINRLGPHWIQPLFYRKYKVNDVMKEKGAYEDEKYINHTHPQIWKRGDDWNHQKCSITVNPDYDKQYCLLGINSLYDSKLKQLYQNTRNDFMLLDNTVDTNTLIKKLEEMGYQRIKCYSLLDATDKQLENYFHLICKYTENYEFIEDDTYSTRHSIINKNSKNMKSYVEIGVEYGYTFQRINIDNKIGVDPDPKKEDIRILKMTSDEFFKENEREIDIIFIDGMHQSDYVLRDFNNAINCLSENGIIFIDDILPKTEREQYKIPIKHAYENGILKYRESWTGDVWKVIYFLLQHYKEYIKFEIYEHLNYRGVGKFQFSEKIQISPEKIDEIENYDYNKDFEHYISLIKQSKSQEKLKGSLNFLNSEPFNHIVIDNFVDNESLLKVEQEIRAIPDDKFQRAIVYGLTDVTKNKLSLENMNECGENTKNMIDFLNSNKMIQYLENLTGIEGLQADDFNMGGGIHKIQREGHLNIHADFNIHKKTRKYRRLNLLLYMNSNYKEQYNGHLELWNKEMTKCEKKISPLFNRAVIFRTTDDAYHGHLDPWMAPEGYDRVSFALYYYTDDRPEYEKSEIMDAVWQEPK